MIDLFLEDGDLLEQVKFYEEYFIDESSFLSKLTLSAKIKKLNSQSKTPVNGYPDLIKYHNNPGMKKYIEKSNDIDELYYLKKDLQSTFSTLRKIGDRIKLCKSGENKTNSSYYKYIKKHYIDQGLTEKDVDKTIEELNKLIKYINDKIKKLKSEGK